MLGGQLTFIFALWSRICDKTNNPAIFPGDPLLEWGPIFQSTPKEARKLLIKTFDIEATEEGFALGYKFDFILRGPKATPMEK